MKQLLKKHCRRHLRSLLFAAVALLAPLGAEAAQVPVAKADGKTLTFTFADESQIDGTNVFALPTEGKNGWSTKALTFTKVVFTPAFAAARPTTTRLWFRDFVKLTAVEGMENLNTEAVTNMSYMFAGCVKLAAIDLSHFNTANAINMGYMFRNCYALTTLDMSSFTFTENSIIRSIAESCTGLTSLSIGNASVFATGDFKTAGAFRNVGQSAPVLLTVPSDFDLSKLGTPDADGVYTWLDGKFRLPAPVPVAKLSGDGLTLTFTYAPESAIDSITVFALPTGEETAGWTSSCESVTKVVFAPEFAEARPTTTREWFYRFSNLISIEGMENLVTS